MIDLDLGKCRRARLWLNSLPPARYESRRRISAQAPGEVLARERVGAVELVLPVGPYSMYGLLGGRLVPTSRHIFRLSAGLSSVEGRYFPSELCPEGEELRVGLLDQYANAIEEGLSKTLSSSTPESLPSADLDIDCAVCGRIGSSVVVFTWLIVILIRLLTLPGDVPDTKELLAIFPDTYE